MKKSFLITLTFFYMNSYAANSYHLPDAAYRPYGQNYRDIALTYCVARAYRSEPKASEDAIYSSSGIDNWTRYDLENNTGQIEKLVNKYLSREYHSFEGPSIKLNLMKCMDMYHSKELDALVKKYVRKPNRTYVQDYPEGDHLS